MKRKRLPSIWPIWAIIVVTVAVFTMLVWLVGAEFFLPKLDRSVGLVFNVQVELGQLILGVFGGGAALVAALTYRASIERPEPPSPTEPSVAPDPAPGAPPASETNLSKEEFLELMPDQMLWEIYKIASSQPPSDKQTADDE